MGYADRPRATLLQIVLVLLAAAAAHGTSLLGGFVYDDYLQIVENPWLRDPGSLGTIFSAHVWDFTGWQPISNFYRPLMHTANLAVYQGCGPVAACFHALSLGLHLGVSALAYLLARQLLAVDGAAAARHRHAPLLSGLLFAVYPAGTEAVAWLGSSADLLYAFFGTAALVAHARTAPGRVPVVAPLALLAALLSKETAVILPPLLVLLDLALGRLARDTPARSVIRGYTPYALVLALYLIVRVAVLGALVPVPQVAAGTVGAGNRLLDALRALGWYLQHLVLPVRHNFFPALPPVESALVGGGLLLGLVAVIAVVVAIARRGRRFWLPLGIALLPLVPALASSGALQNRMAERYLYLPALGYCMLLGTAVAPLLRAGTRRRWALAAALLVVLGALSATRDATFRDELALWREAIRSSPDLPAARAYLATALFRAGRLEEGVVVARAAAALDGTMQSNWYDLGEALRRLGRFEESAQAFEQLLRLVPGDAQALTRLGEVYLALGKAGNAVERLERARSLNTSGAETRFLLGLAYDRVGRPGEALRELRAAQELRPGLPGVTEAIDVISRRPPASPDASPAP